MTYLQNPPAEQTLYESYYETVPQQMPAELSSIIAQRLAVMKVRSPAGRVLDVGCGPGFFLAEARAAGYDVHGIDVSALAVRFAAESLHLPAEVASLEDVAARDASFDIITLWHVLEHFLNPVAELQKIRKLMAPGAYLYLEVPNLHSIKFRLSGRKWVGGNHPLYHRTFFTKTTLEKTIALAGFQQSERLLLSYRVPGHSGLYSSVKKISNLVAMDAFLTYMIRA
ncbi:MAG: class I SAM-dependent methyltransferase [Ignavibacteriales bacterium]|nr:class I SAM-dependent methyltransferase [Ignavibacteriales bacterium]